MSSNIAAASKDDRNNKSVDTHPTVAFLLKQVNIAHNEKIKGLQSEVQKLKLELKRKKSGYENCKQCEILKEELKECKGNYLKSLSDQKHRIEILEGKLLAMQHIPTSKNKILLPSETKEESPCDTNMDKQICKKQKTSSEVEFVPPLNMTKRKFLSFPKLECLGKENAESLILQPLSNILAPATLDVDINDDADITVIGIYGKQESSKIIMETKTVPESIDIDIEPEINDAVDGLMEVAPKYCNEIRTNLEHSPSLLPPITLLLRKPEYSIENKDRKVIPLPQFLSEKSGSDLPQVSIADADILVTRDATSPSLISPPEKKLKLCMDIPQSEHKSSVFCSSVCSFENRDLCKSEITFEDMDETYYPLPLTSHNMAKQNGNFESNKENEVVEVEDAPGDVLIVNEKCIPEAELEQSENHVALDIGNPAIENSFDRVPKKDNDIRYKFKEDPVRKKEERARLLGHPCKQCEEYYNKLDIPESEKVKRITKCSRHRAVHKAPTTPEHYWELSFPDTPECKARGYADETQMIQLKPRRKCPLSLRKDK